MATNTGSFTRRTAAGVALLTIVWATSAYAEDGAAAGAKVFAEQKCALCHSVAGKGNAKGPLDAVGSTLSAAEIREWITDAKGMTAKTSAPRKPAMKAYTLEKGDVDTLVTYLSAMKKT
jgi:mono/diheme cytochrome c family protein